MSPAKKMKHGMSQASLEDLLAFLRAFRPTRTLLARATREYLKDYPRRGNPHKSTNTIPQAPTSASGS